MVTNDYSISLDCTKDELEDWLFLWRGRQSYISSGVNGEYKAHQAVSQESDISSVGFSHGDNNDSECWFTAQTTRSKEKRSSAGSHHHDDDDDDDDDDDFSDIARTLKPRKHELSAGCNLDTDEDNDVGVIDLVSKSNKKRSATLKESPASQNATSESCNPPAKKRRHDIRNGVQVFASGPRSSVSWTDKESRALIAGIRTRNGTFNWTTLKVDAGDDLKNRTNIDIKHKWLAFLYAASKVAKTDEEAEFIDKVALTKGRLNWNKIYKDSGLPMDLPLRANIEHAHDAFWRNVETGIQNVLRKEAKTGQASYYRQGRWIF